MNEKGIKKFEQHLEVLSELCANNTCNGCPAYNHGCMFINRAIPCYAYNEYLHTKAKINKLTKEYINKKYGTGGLQ